MLQIEVWKPTGTLDVTRLRAGCYTEIKPGEFHRFTALTDVVAFELYWAEFDPDDIEREAEGE